MGGLVSKWFRGRERALPVRTPPRVTLIAVTLVGKYIESSQRICVAYCYGNNVLRQSMRVNTFCPR